MVKKLIKKGHKLIKKHNRLVKDTSILMIGTIFAFIFNYIFQIFMGRSLGPEGYGIMSTLFAFLYIIQMFAGTIQITSANFTAKFMKNNELGKIKYKFLELLKWILYYGTLIFAIYLLFIPLLKHYTRIYDTTAFVVLGLIALMSLTFSIYTGILNGMQKFYLQTITGTIGLFIKLISGIILVLIGFNYISGLYAVLFGGVIGIIIGHFIFKKILIKKEEKFNLKELFNYSTPVLFSTIFFSLIFTIDTIILKSQFPAHDVGLYAAASLIGKLFYFGTGIIIGLIFPKLSGEKSMKKSKFILDLSISIISIIGVFFILISYFFSKLMMELIYGSKYLAISNLQWIFASIFVLYSLNFIFLNFYYAKHLFKFANFAIIFFIVEIIGMYIFNNSLYEIVKFLLILNFIYFALNLFIRFKYLKNEKP